MEGAVRRRRLEGCVGFGHRSKRGERRRRQGRGRSHSREGIDVSRLGWPALPRLLCNDVAFAGAGCCMCCNVRGCGVLVCMHLADTYPHVHTLRRTPMVRASVLECSELPRLCFLQVMARSFLLVTLLVVVLVAVLVVVSMTTARCGARGGRRSRLIVGALARAAAVLVV